jgi:hypothetical protein
MTLYTEPPTPGDYAGISFYAAQQAFINMGFEVAEVSSMDALQIQEPHVFLGSIAFIQAALQKMGRPVPPPLDYPASLHAFLGRQIKEAPMSQIVNNPGEWNVFIKPKGLVKQFEGRLVKSTKDLIGCGALQGQDRVWVSEPVRFIAEWRVFVRYGTVLGVRPYKGDWRAQYNHSIIEAAIASFTDAPAGYALDFGLTNDQRLLLVEANDGYALGHYGLFYTDYAKLLAARWAQLTAQKDVCAF